MRDARLTYLEHRTANLVSCISHHVSRITYRASLIAYLVISPSFLVVLCTVLCPRGAARLSGDQRDGSWRFSVLWRTPVLSGMRLSWAEISRRRSKPKSAHGARVGGFVLERHQVDAGQMGSRVSASSSPAFN